MNRRIFDFREAKRMLDCGIEVEVLRESDLVWLPFPSSCTITDKSKFRCKDDGTLNPYLVGDTDTFGDGDGDWVLLGRHPTTDKMVGQCLDLLLHHDGGYDDDHVAQIWVVWMTEKEASNLMEI